MESDLAELMFAPCHMVACRSFVEKSLLKEAVFPSGPPGLNCLAQGCDENICAVPNAFFVVLLNY